MSFFPMLIELEGAPCLVVGGGEVARRKAMVLCDFGALVTVVAPDICSSIYDMEGVICHCRQYEETDLQDRSLVVAATADAALNHRISEECRARGIPVNAVDQPEDCDFIFPSYIRRGEVVAAFSSGGQSPVVAQYLKRKNEPVLTDELGQLAECLGSLRKMVKKRIRNPQRRREVYERVLRLGLVNERVPQETEIQNIIKEMEDHGPYETVANE